MTDRPPFTDLNTVSIQPWLPVEPVRMGFGGLVYWRSRDHVNGRYRWEISPSAQATKTESEQR